MTRNLTNDVEKYRIHCGNCPETGQVERLATPINVEKIRGKGAKDFEFQCENCGLQGNVYKLGRSFYRLENL